MAKIRRTLKSVRMGDASGGGRWEILFNKVYINPMQLERVNEQAVMTARYPILKPCDRGGKQIELYYYSKLQMSDN